MVIDQIREKLAQYPNVKFNADAHTICIHPEPGGFEVGVLVHANGLTVFFEGWHEDFGSAEEALNCLFFGLSESCRLRVFQKGGVDYKWVVEERDGNKWRHESEVGLLVYPFWRVKKERVLQNHLIKAGCS